MKREKIDEFLGELFGFLYDLHSCFSSNCKYVLHQINNKGIQRSFCDKYKQRIKLVHRHCIDRYLGFNGVEIKEIEKQYKAGKCQLVINGEAV